MSKTSRQLWCLKGVNSSSICREIESWREKVEKRIWVGKYQMVLNLESELKKSRHVLLLW
jgi:hypothetical protein